MSDKDIYLDLRDKLRPPKERTGFKAPKKDPIKWGELAQGSAAGLLGAPVDLVNLLTRVKKPVMGSEWIGDKLGADTSSLEFDVGQFIDPMTMTKAAIPIASTLAAMAIADKAGSASKLPKIAKKQQGIIGRANKDLLDKRVNDGDISDADREKYIKFLANRDDWQSNMWTDPKTKFNYFYGPDGVLREEIPDVISKTDRLQAPNYTIEHPSSYNKTTLNSEVNFGGRTYPVRANQILKSSVDTAYQTQPLNSGSNLWYPNTNASSIKIPKRYGSTDKKELLRDYFAPAEKNARRAEVNSARKDLHERFQNSILAHELNHTWQNLTGLPRGSNTETALRDSYKLLEPGDKARYKVGRDILVDDFAKDEFRAQVYAAQQPDNIRDLLRKVIENRSKESPVYEAADESSVLDATKKKLIGYKQEMDQEGMVNDFYKLYREGKLEGAKLGPIEDFLKLQKKGFDRYNATLGEVESRAVQKRYFDATKPGVNPEDIYSTHPYSKLDVNPEDIWW